jgi:hypothetical protein
MSTYDALGKRQTGLIYPLFSTCEPVLRHNEPEMDPFRHADRLRIFCLMVPVLSKFANRPNATPMTTRFRGSSYGARNSESLSLSVVYPVLLQLRPSTHRASCPLCHIHRQYSCPRYVHLSVRTDSHDKSHLNTPTASSTIDADGFTGVIQGALPCLKEGILD